MSVELSRGKVYTWYQICNGKGQKLEGFSTGNHTRTYGGTKKGLAMIGRVGL